MKADSVTYIGFVQDHSGSMVKNKQLAVDNFNEQRASLLKEDDECMDNLVTIVEFDDEIHCYIDNMPINEIKKMKEWWCGGMTALYDGIGFCISNIKEKMETDKREDKAALIIIQTDGVENKSSDYAGEKGRQKINEMINELEETKTWTFVFLGENIDKEIAIDMGFKIDNIMSHKSNETRFAYAASTNGLRSYMSERKKGNTQVMNFYDDKTSAKKPDSILTQENTNDNNNQ